MKEAYAECQVIRFQKPVVKASSLLLPQESLAGLGKVRYWWCGVRRGGVGVVGADSWAGRGLFSKPKSGPGQGRGGWRVKDPIQSRQ